MIPSKNDEDLLVIDDSKIPPSQKRSAAPFLAVVVTVMVLCGLAIAWFFRSEKHSAEHIRKDEPRTQIGSNRQMLQIAPRTWDAMKIATTVVRSERATRRIRMTGQLTLDPSRLVHVQARFSGEVVDMGPDLVATDRPIRVGDRVAKGQKLATLWSREIGEKKSDLVDALSQLALHRKIVSDLTALDRTGAVSQRAIDEMQRNFQSDLILAERLRRTLRSWRISEDEIHEVEEEAKRVQALSSDPANSERNTLANHVFSNPNGSQSWAEFEIRSPLDGIVMEENITVGDIVVPDNDLFKIANLDRLGIMANVFEEDLPVIQQLSPEMRKWSVHLNGSPTNQVVEGSIETIGNIIDPSQHSGVIQGWIDNQYGNLRVGQFVEVTVAIPAAGESLSVPVTAVMDQGDKKYVWIQSVNDPHTLHKVQVDVVKREELKLFIRQCNNLQSALNIGDDQNPDLITSNDESSGVLCDGAVIVTDGVLELEDTLELMKSESLSKT